MVMVRPEDQNYYRTKEAAKKLGISKQTLLRWFSEGKVNDVNKRDRNGWRLFSDQDISRIKKWMLGDTK